MTVYNIKPIHSVDMRQNDTDGAILVELNGTIDADIINADMYIVSGTPPNNNTLYDIYNRLIAAPATEAKQDTVIAGVGAITDVPLAAETLEGATARSGISLWKRAVNKLIDIKALLVKGTAVMTSALAVTIATDDTQLGSIGAAADYDGNIHGQLRYLGDNSDKIHVHIDDLSAIATWAESTDAYDITADDDHIPEHGIANSISIGKDGTTVVDAFYGKTIASIDASALDGDAVVTFYTKHANYTNVAYVWVRLGTDAANYHQYQVDPDAFGTGWETARVSLKDGVQTLAGVDLSAITYIAIGMTMDAAGNTVADIFFNSLFIHSIIPVELQIVSNVANSVRVSKIGAASNATPTVGSGNLSTGTQRITLATDDINVAKLVAGQNIFTATGKSVTDMEYVSIEQAGAGTAVIHADTSGHHYYLMGLVGSMTVAGTVQLRDVGDAGDATGAMNWGTNGGAGLVPTGFPLYKSGSGNGIELVSVTGGFNGMAMFLDITE